MLIQDPQQQHIFSAQFHALHQRKEALNKAIDALNTCRDNINKRKATAEALQSEAKTLRQNARQSLRDMIGIPGKATREAKEKELAAQSLAEEMLLIAEEETLLAEQEHEQLWQEKINFEAECRAALDQYCQVLLEEQMELLAEQMPVLALLFDIAPEQTINKLIGVATFGIDKHGDYYVNQPKGLILRALEKAEAPEKDEHLHMLLSSINLEKPKVCKERSLISKAAAIKSRDEKLKNLLNRE